MTKRARTSKEAAELAIQLLADVLRDLAIEENKAGEVARLILRAEAAGQHESVAHLVAPLLREIQRVMPAIRKKDPKTGRWLLNFDLPGEWPL